MYPLPALIPFTTEEITGCTNVADKGANKPQKSPLSCFFVSRFITSVTPSINIPESSNHFMILIILFISSFKIIKVNPFLTLTAPFPLILFSSLFIAFEVKLLTNLNKLSLSKGIAAFVSDFFSKLAN